MWHANIADFYNVLHRLKLPIAHRSVDASFVVLTDRSEEAPQQE